MDNLDWSLIRSFLAVADAGSLSAAARATGISQPTLGRHVREAEAALGSPLFQRSVRGQHLTDAGQALLPAARDMKAAAARLSMAATAQDPALAGPVRVTASRIVAHYLLPPMLAALRDKEPAIRVDLVASDESDNLLFREADIALRMYRPTQLDVITRHLCDLPLGLYAARTYLARHPAPLSEADLARHSFLGFDTSDRVEQIMRSFGMDAAQADFSARCDDQIVYWNLVRAGLGIGGMQVLIGDADPTVARVAPFLTLPPLPVWLTAPEALRQSPRIRRVFDHLAASFTGLPLDPPARIG